MAARVVGSGSGFGIHLAKVTTCARRVDGVDHGLWATDGVVQNGQIKERHEPGGAQAATIIHSVARVGEMRQHASARREPENDARVDDRADLHHQYGLEREERRPLRHVERHLVAVEREAHGGREEQGKARRAIVRELDVLGIHRYHHGDGERVVENGEGHHDRGHALPAEPGEEPLVGEHRQHGLEPVIQVEADVAERA